MLYTKIFDTTLNVRNPIEFCADIDAGIINELKKKYEGKCYKGAFIISVEKILNRSGCIITSTNTTGAGEISVQFAARVSHIANQDILVGIKILNNSGFVVGLCQNEKAQIVVSFLNTKGIETLAIDQYALARVVIAHHVPMEPRITAIGNFLTCDTEAPVYHVEKYQDGAMQELNIILGQIDVELELRNQLMDLHKESILFFESLLYSFNRPKMEQVTIPTGKNSPTWVGLGITPKETEHRNFVEFVRTLTSGTEVQGFWSRSLEIYRSSPLVAWAASPPSHWNPATESDMRVTFVILLKNILDNLIAIREMIETYNTRDLIDNHSNIWAVMRLAQKE
jgi:hypothetical protein